MNKKSETLRIESEKRRSYRRFIPCEIDKDTIEDWLMTASTAPSGANKQPWFFCVVSNEVIKKEIRDKSEETEKIFYERLISKEWKEDLNILNLDYNKRFLTEASCLIIVFKQMYQVKENGKKESNYYVNESSGIAIGLLINAIRESGYYSLTYTPAPMIFLKEYFRRPDGEFPVMIIAVGKANPEYDLPELSKKGIDDIANFYE